MPLTFPTHLFNPASIRMTLQGRTITSPPSISGVGQVLRTDGGGFWICEMSGIVLNAPDKLRGWRAWIDTLDGGVLRVNVPIADNALAPRPLQGGKPARPGPLHAATDDPYFPEAVAYGTPLMVASMAPAALRATQAAITVTQGARIRGGENFSIAHATLGKRIYRIGRVLSRDGQTATVSIRPPLREAFAGGNADFDWPAFEAIAVSATDAEPDIQYGRRAEVAITFREAL